MKYKNTPFLRDQFKKDSIRVAKPRPFTAEDFRRLAKVKHLEIDEEEFQRHLETLNQTSTESEEVKKDRAAYRAATAGGVTISSRNTTAKVTAAAGALLVLGDIAFHWLR